MVCKRGSVFFSLVLLSVFLLSLNFVSAAVSSCQLVSGNCLSEEGTQVLKISSLTNAHAALPGQGSYGYSLCCSGDAGEQVVCDLDVPPSNKILGLSSATNAHAQSPSETSYGYNACFGEMECTSVVSTVCPSEYPIETVSISSSTNAHVAQFGYYATQICCTAGGATGPTCGDGVIEAPEECDDNNFNNFDGCSNACEIESIGGEPWICTGTPSCCISPEPYKYWEKDSTVSSVFTVYQGDIFSLVTVEDFCQAPGSSGPTISIYKDKTFGGDELITTVSSVYYSGELRGTWGLSGSHISTLGFGYSDIYFTYTSPSGTQTSNLVEFFVAGICGDGTVNTGEQCDDGNNADGDGCDSSCQEETGYTCNSESPSCCYEDNPTASWRHMNNVPFNGGEIYEGKTLNPYIEDNFCIAGGERIESQIYYEQSGTSAPHIRINDLVWLYNDWLYNENGALKGNWTISSQEISDILGYPLLPGATRSIYFRYLDPVDNVWINSQSVPVEIVTPVCGDGILHEGVEQCDDGNTQSGDSCSSECEFETQECGNDIVETPEEQCDDGNTQNGDGCSSSCQLEPCTITSASWDGAGNTDVQALEGDSVQLFVETSNCVGETVSFEIKESDGIGNPDDDVTTNPSSVTVPASGQSTTLWTAEYQQDTDGLQSDPPEYYFTASIVSEGESEQSSNELEVSQAAAQCLDTGGSEIISCGQYETQTDCEADVCSIANSEGVDIGESCGEGGNCECYWDTEDDGGTCKFSTEVWTDCGDGILNTGEQCDSSVPSGISCNTFDDFDGGSLDCTDSCVYDTNLCTGGHGIGVCGDGVVNIGEQCDGNDWGESIQGCSDLNPGYAGGTLGCIQDLCIFDASQCTGAVEPTVPGQCIRTEIGGDTCEGDGLLSQEVVVTWTGAPEDQPESCQDFSRVVPCAASIRVPFFGLLQFIVAVILIVLIYLALKSMQKSKKHKSKKKS